MFGCAHRATGVTFRLSLVLVLSHQHMPIGAKFITLTVVRRRLSDVNKGTVKVNILVFLYGLYGVPKEKVHIQNNV